MSIGEIGGLYIDAHDLSRADLDSHTNMVVVDNHAEIINDTGRRADVSPFNPDYE